MLILKKIFTFFVTLLLYSQLVMSFSTLAYEENTSNQENIISQVNFLFKEDSEKLLYNEVVELGNDIILRRDEFPSEVLAKTYLLLANVASNKGELETAHQFTKDGLDIYTGHKTVKLCLQIKLANILSTKRQYEELLEIAQQALKIPQSKENLRYSLFALSYRSVAFAMLNQHEKAFIDLQKVESLIKENPSFGDHISLLAILANAHYHLGGYQTALTMHLKILKLRFSLNKLENVDQTYYHLANDYYRLNRFNDAYNAFWEAKRYARKKSALIYIAYASQGVGISLMQQKQYIEAKAEIIEAKALFYQNNLSKPYLETVISLALLNSRTGQKSANSKLLLEAEHLSESIELKFEYIILYQLLADFYKEKGNVDRAFYWQKKYSAALLKQQEIASVNQQLLISNKVINNNPVNTVMSKQVNQLAVKLSEQSELTTSFSEKYELQRTIIFILSALLLLMFCFVIFLRIKSHARKLKEAHEELEKSNYVIASPIQTKQIYQKNFNMARKYAYPLTMGYISITNWQELTFQFNKKIVGEVSREIASVINEHINEFENAGLINDGEYLLLFPHQNKDEVSVIIEKLVSALKLRFFANLGGFSVIISYSIESPSFQDIDPYIFLSQLSDSINIA